MRATTLRQIDATERSIAMLRKKLEKDFPELEPATYDPNSPDLPKYNMQEMYFELVGAQMRIWETIGMIEKAYDERGEI